MCYLDEGMNVVARGISLKGLRTILNEYERNLESFKNFVEKNPRIKECVRCPGETVTHMLVKPETRQSDCYVELLYGVFNRKVRDATTDREVESITKDLEETLGAVNVFVSHTWKYNFATLINSVDL